MSLPQGSDLLTLGWGADGDPFVLLAPSGSVDTTLFGWGADGDPFNFSPTTVPVVLLALAGNASTARVGTPGANLVTPAAGNASSAHLGAIGYTRAAKLTKAAATGRVGAAATTRVVTPLSIVKGAAYAGYIFRPNFPTMRLARVTATGRVGAPSSMDVVMLAEGRAAASGKLGSVVAGSGVVRLLTGVQGTSKTGQVLASQITLAGVVASTHAGAVTATQLTIRLIGNPAKVLLGDYGVNGLVTRRLSRVAASAQVHSVIAIKPVLVSGVAASGRVNSPTPSWGQPLSGVAPAVGTVGGVVAGPMAAVRGQTISCKVGSVGVSVSADRQLLGVQALGAVGAVALAATLSPTGARSQLLAGVLAPSMSKAAAGVVASTAIGRLTNTTGLYSVAGAGRVGSVRAARSITPIGAKATARAGHVGAGAGGGPIAFARVAADEAFAITIVQDVVGLSSIDSADCILTDVTALAVAQL
jgi:hypothetical protein